MNDSSSDSYWGGIVKSLSPWYAVKFLHENGLAGFFVRSSAPPAARRSTPTWGAWGASQSSGPDTSSLRPSSSTTGGRAHSS